MCYSTGMKNIYVAILLSTFMVLYLIGRILQLFAGKVPNLVIVAFHVIPPMLFALIHASRTYRWRGALVFVASCLGVATLFESVSLRIGFPFGHYRFTDVMGPKLFQLPILLALAYVGMGYLSWVVALAIVKHNIALLPITAGLIMTS